jgi:hypothetical protein
LCVRAVLDVAVRLLNLRNPATGDFLIPAPLAGAQLAGTDAGGNPYLGQRNVFPANFNQDQFTIKMDGRLNPKNALTGTFFFSNFPGFDPFPDPLSLASPVTVRRSDRNRTFALSDVQLPLQIFDEGCPTGTHVHNSANV